MKKLTMLVIIINIIGVLIIYGINVSKPENYWTSCAVPYYPQMIHIPFIMMFLCVIDITYCIYIIVKSPKDKEPK